ncbi:MAG: transposase [Bacteroidetes bacterium]|nr:transposase [Bacteroidota bacterium]
MTEEWVFDYNHLRPHDALKGMPPVAYREKMKKNENVPYGLRSASGVVVRFQCACNGLL